MGGVAIPRYYTTRARVKAAAGLEGAEIDADIDRLIESHSRNIDHDARTWFIPTTETRTYDLGDVFGRCLFLDAHLLSVTTLTDQGTTARSWSEGTHFELEPRHADRYTRVEALLAGAYRFSGGSSAENAITIVGEWGFSAETTPAGAINGSGINDETGTSMSVTNGALLDVGDSILVDSEKLFVSDRTDEDLGVNLSANLTAIRTDTIVTIGDPTFDLNVGEVIRVNSEKMIVRSVNSATSVIVSRAHDGTTLAAHTSGDDVYVERAFTVVRAQHGSTAAAHIDTTSIDRYVPDGDVSTIVLEKVTAALHRERAGAAADRLDAGGASQPFVGANMTMDYEQVISRTRFWG